MDEVLRPGIPETTTFGDLLQRAARGEAVFYAVFDDEKGVSFTFSEVDDPLIANGQSELLIPMSAEDAQDMYNHLLEESPEELEEVTTRVDDDETHSNN